MLIQDEQSADSENDENDYLNTNDSSSNKSTTPISQSAIKMRYLIEKYKVPGKIIFQIHQIKIIFSQENLISETP